jgi:hypothetical protein
VVLILPHFADWTAYLEGRPTVANGRVYVPTFDSGVLVFYPTTTGQ